MLTLVNQTDEQSAWDRVQSRLSIPRNVQYQPSTANAAATSSSSSSGRIGHVPMKPFYLVNNDPTRSIKGCSVCLLYHPCIHTCNL